MQKSKCTRAQCASQLSHHWLIEYGLYNKQRVVFGVLDFDIDRQVQNISKITSHLLEIEQFYGRYLFSTHYKHEYSVHMSLNRFCLFWNQLIHLDEALSTTYQRSQIPHKNYRNNSMFSNWEALQNKIKQNKIFTKNSICLTILCDAAYSDYML